jgi:hypothetical protein
VCLSGTESVTKVQVIIDTKVLSVFPTFDEKTFPRKRLFQSSRIYSYHNASTGFALAAFAAVPPTVTHAMHSAINPLPMNTKGVRSMRWYIGVRTHLKY